jgi:hypothetical protein
VSNIYNNNKASNAKIGQNVNKAVYYFFARFFRVNLVRGMLCKFILGVNSKSSNIAVLSELGRFKYEKQIKY